MELLISRRTTHLPSLLSTVQPQGALKDVLQTLLRREDEDLNVEVSLVLCDDAFIRELNARYRGLDKPTDVLSFGQEDEVAPPAPNSGGAGEAGFVSAPPELGAGGALIPRLLGDIVISLPTAERQAERAGWPVESEVALLTVHGLLHLLGHEDETEEGAREMQVRTVAALSECGIGLPDAGIHPFLAEYE